MDQTLKHSSRPAGGRHDGMPPARARRVRGRRHGEARVLARASHGDGVPAAGDDLRRRARGLRLRERAHDMHGTAGRAGLRAGAQPRAPAQDAARARRDRRAPARHRAGARQGRRRSAQLRARIRGRREARRARGALQHLVGRPRVLDRHLRRDLRPREAVRPHRRPGVGADRGGQRPGRRRRRAARGEARQRRADDRHASLPPRAGQRGRSRGAAARVVPLRADLRCAGRHSHRPRRDDPRAARGAPVPGRGRHRRRGHPRGTSRRCPTRSSCRTSTGCASWATRSTRSVASSRPRRTSRRMRGPSAARAASFRDPGPPTCQRDDAGRLPEFGESVRFPGDFVNSGRSMASRGVCGAGQRHAQAQGAGGQPRAGSSPPRPPSSPRAASRARAWTPSPRAPARRAR